MFSVRNAGPHKRSLAPQLFLLPPPSFRFQVSGFKFQPSAFPLSCLPYFCDLCAFCGWNLSFKWDGEEVNGREEAAFFILPLIRDPPHECGGLPICVRSNDTSVVAANEEVNGGARRLFSFSFSFTTPHMWGAP